MVPEKSHRPNPQSVFMATAQRFRAASAALALVAGIAFAYCDDAPPNAPENAAFEGQSDDWSAFNIKDVFPDGTGRDLVLDNCQSCHVLVPILVLPMDEGAWYRNSLEHRERVEGLNDTEFKTLYEYLASNFTPDRPKPKLPPALLDTWTTY